MALIVFDCNETMNGNIFREKNIGKVIEIYIHVYEIFVKAFILVQKAFIFIHARNGVSKCCQMKTA